MAAAEYYMHGAGGGAHGAHDPHESPVTYGQSPTYTSPLDRPLPPNPPSYHTEHFGSGSGGPYAPNHHSSQSVDTAYEGHRPDSFSSLNQLAPKDGYGDNIPLHRTDTHSHPIDAAEAGRRPRRGKHAANAVLSGGMRRPWFIWFISVVQVAVFIAELARNAVLTGSPIMTKPYFNPMIGPSPNCLVEMGARYVPCMRRIDHYNDDPSHDLFFCPNSTVKEINIITDSNGNVHSNETCELATTCGFNGNGIPSDFGGTGGKGSHPNQWWRFIVPMFMHAGLVHIAFNLFSQIFVGGEMERKIGPLRLAFVYFSSGIFGFVMGGAVGQLGMPSVGASGCLFGVFALDFLGVLYEWDVRRSPARDLSFLMLDMVIAFVIGLLPGVDNFSHIGGFLCGTCIGLTVLHSPNRLRRKVGLEQPPYTRAQASNPYNSSTGDNKLAGTAALAFVRDPVSFFKGRSGYWWAWWLVRALALTGALVALIIMLNSFYDTTGKGSCSWCKYLSCIPVSNWCSMYDLVDQPNGTTSAANQARELLGRALGMAEGLDRIDL